MAISSRRLRNDGPWRWRAFETSDWSRDRLPVRIYFSQTLRVTATPRASVLQLEQDSGLQLTKALPLVFPIGLDPAKCTQDQDASGIFQLKQSVLNSAWEIFCNKMAWLGAQSHWRPRNEKPRTQRGPTASKQHDDTTDSCKTLGHCNLKHSNHRFQSKYLLYSFVFFDQSRALKVLRTSAGPASSNAMAGAAHGLLHRTNFGNQLLLNTVNCGVEPMCRPMWVDNALKTAACDSWSEGFKSQQKRSSVRMMDI